MFIPSALETQQQMTYFLKGDTLPNMELDLFNTMNSISVELRSHKSASQFRTKLKVYFLSQYDDQE